MKLDMTGSKLWAVALGVAVSGWAGMALAGLSETILVTVNTTSRFAEGAVQAVRSSADAVQFIKCIASGVIQCDAKSSAGTTGSCTLAASGTNYARLRLLTLGINSSSFVRFEWDSTGKCTSIRVTNSSTHLKA